MNNEGNYETGMYEAEGMYGEAESGIGLETGEAPHPTFGMVTPLSGESGEHENFEQYQGEYLEAPTGASSMVPHPVFGMVRPLGARASEVFEAEEEIIGTGDERFRVTNTTPGPYRWMCFLELRFPGFLASGSGLLISPRHVLTCGHNLFDHHSKTAAAAVTVTPGCNGVSNRPFGHHAATAWRTTTQWRASPNARFDFGLITLRHPIGNQRMRAIGNHTLDHWGKPGTHTLLVPIQPGSTAFRGKRVTVSGYPGDKAPGEQWAANGIVTSVTPNGVRELIFYTADTCAGHSGSPVWFRRGNDLCLFAIHTGPCIAGPDCQLLGRSRCSNTPTWTGASSNRAVLFSPTVWARVRGWMGP